MYYVCTLEGWKNFDSLIDAISAASQDLIDDCLSDGTIVPAIDALMYDEPNTWFVMPNNVYEGPENISMYIPAYTNEEIQEIRDRGDDASDECREVQLNPELTLICHGATNWYDDYRSYQYKQIYSHKIVERLPVDDAVF